MIKSNLGLSMIVAPGYIISERFEILTYGQSEFLVETIVFIIFCVIIKKMKFSFLLSYVTIILYSIFADAMKAIIPIFNENIHLTLNIRIFYFIIGMILSGFAISLFYNTYLYPQIYDFFVKVVANRKKIPIKIYKTCFDLTFLVISVILSYLAFHKLVGIGIGTLIMACFNGLIIGQFEKKVQDNFTCIPYFKKLYNYLEGEIEDGI